MGRPRKFRDEDWEALLEAPSKTEQKKEMDRLQELGLFLTQLPLKVIKALPVGELTSSQILELSQIKSFEARRRQSQLIAKLLRQEDVALLVEELLKNRSAKEYATWQRWVDHLVNNEELAVVAFSKQFKDVERHVVRQLALRASADADLPPAIKAEAKASLQVYVALKMLL